MTKQEFVKEQVYFKVSDSISKFTNTLYVDIDKLYDKSIYRTLVWKLQRPIDVVIDNQIKYPLIFTYDTTR